jgi:SAM-dependent methyltransferase
MDYPCLAAFSREIGIPAEALVRAFEIERAFHEAVLAESDPARRRMLIREVYANVHPIYGKTEAPYDPARNTHVGLIRRLRGLFTNCSVLDIGCGRGDLLRGIAEKLPHGRLLGIEASEAMLPQGVSGIEFRAADIISFGVDQPFDVVVSENVTEHVAPRDLDEHLCSVRRALREGGALVLLMPHRLFGPSDVTRIIDNTYSNRVPAMGTHLNESTNREMIVALRGHGFRRFRPIARLPLAMQLMIERGGPLLGLIYRIRRHGRPFFARPIGLVCS